MPDLSAKMYGARIVTMTKLSYILIPKSCESVSSSRVMEARKKKVWSRREYHNSQEKAQLQKYGMGTDYYLSSNERQHEEEVGAQVTRQTKSLSGI